MGSNGARSTRTSSGPSALTAAMILAKGSWFRRMSSRTSRWRWRDSGTSVSAAGLGSTFPVPSGVRGGVTFPHHAPQRGEQVVGGDAGDARRLGHRDTRRHHSPEELVPELLEVWVIAGQHLHQLRVLVEQSTQRDIPGDHASALPVSFRAFSSASRETPAEAAASVSVSWAPQQWLMPIAFITSSV